MFNIKDIVKDNRVEFSHYRKGYAYYRVDISRITKADQFDGMQDVERDYYVFPVDLNDIGDATLLREDKALIFMRYIRKALEEGTFVKG